jgi:predicted transcriptional regulator
VPCVLTAFAKTEELSVFAGSFSVRPPSRYHAAVGGKTNKLVRWLGVERPQRVPDLGERELAVLEVLWKHGRSSAQAVREHMPGAPISLSTAQSTLERLHRKQLLRREKQGRAYQYRAVLSRSELIGDLLRDLARDVAGGELAPMLSGFLDFVSGEAPELEPEVSRALGLNEGRRRKPADE